MKKKAKQIFLKKAVIFWTVNTFCKKCQIFKAHERVSIDSLTWCDSARSIFSLKSVLYTDISSFLQKWVEWCRLSVSHCRLSVSREQISVGYTCPVNYILFTLDVCKIAIFIWVFSSCEKLTEIDVKCLIFCYEYKLINVLHVQK